jgi:cysteine desulfurase family protein
MTEKNKNAELIYLDNAATTYPKPEVVYEAMDHFYRQFGGNAGRGSNPLARKAAALVDETRSLANEWLGAGEVVFSSSATVALNTAIFGTHLRPGDVIYLTPFEHNSVLRPVEHLRKTKGIQVAQIPFNKATMACDLTQAIELFLIEPPSMLCLTHVSNVFGVIMPVAELIAAARAANPDVIVIVDGAQAAGLLPLPMAEIDALVFSGHKSFYGPYGVAGIAFNRTWRPQPLLYGGTGTVSESIDMPDSGPSRFEAGSHDISAMAGLNAALKWLKNTGRDNIRTHSCELTEGLRDNLDGMDNVTVYAPEDKCQQFGIVSFNIEGVSPQAVETKLGANNVAVRAGLHCAPLAHQLVGSKLVGGTIRISFGHSNKQEDIEILIRCLCKGSIISTN